MIKPNVLAGEVMAVAMTQLQQSWNFKRPRVDAIKRYRRLYNTQVLPKLRQQFNVPLPIFAGMIDTLQADLNDKMLIEYQYTDPADWKAIEKANAAIKQESESARAGAQWDDKFASYRFEKILTGRGTLKFLASSAGGYESTLSVTPFEDFYYEPMGGGTLENHIFAGEGNIWRTKSQLQQGAIDGLYEKSQVAKLLEGGSGYKQASIWDGEIDIGNRYKSLGLTPETNNYVGEPVYNFVEWVMEYKGRRWYLLFEPFSGTWIRFEKNSDVCSADLFPWMSSASHKDIKNFTSKSFADDLYPIADSVITLFNQDLTNRSKVNLNARAFDKQMFKDVQKLDEAQYRNDALVPVDTFNGTRRINEGIYAFTTPQLTGTIDLIDWIQSNAGQNLGVNDMQQGASQPVSKKVGVTYAELAQISKRLSFTSAPFKRMGQELGERFFVSLKDYMKQPMAIQLLGERGYEWDVLRRIDLKTKRNFEIKVSSELQQNNANDAADAQVEKALTMTAASTNINPKVRDEMILRRVGKLPEHDIALLMDTSTTADKETQAEVAAAIQEILMRSTKPKINYNADRYFIKRLYDFATKHRDTLKPKQFDLLMEYAEEHFAIVEENVVAEAERDARLAMAGGVVPGMPAMPMAPENNPVTV